MNSRIKPSGIPGKQKQVQITINLNDLDTVRCANCGFAIFATNVAMYKRIGATQSPTGKAMLAGIQLNVCQDCGAIMQVVDDELKLVEIAPGDGKADEGDGP